MSLNKVEINPCKSLKVSFLMLGIGG